MGVRTLDDKCRKAIDGRPNVAVPWFMMSSFLYYHLDESIISDGLYEELAKTIRDNWSSITHPHKALITADNLEAGSLYDLPLTSYPRMAIEASLDNLATISSKRHAERLRREVAARLETR